jgi:hypothetical protein
MLQGELVRECVVIIDAVDGVYVCVTTETPHEAMMRVVSTYLTDHQLPIQLQSEAPSHWERHGDVLMLPEGSFVDNAWPADGDIFWGALARV